jgi:hypothetical protein
MDNVSIASELTFITPAAKAEDKTPMTEFWGRWRAFFRPDIPDDDNDYHDYEDMPKELYVDGHVSCCGATFLSGFGYEPTNECLGFLDNILGKEGNQRHLFECVLIDDQLNCWEKPLEDRGFKVVARWYNGNSGNNCNLLIKHMEAED